MRISPPRASARKTAVKAQRTQQTFSWPTPTEGLVANGNIAQTSPASCLILDNLRCTPTGVVTRRGKQRYVTIDGPVRSIFSYKAGAVERIFACSDTTRFDVTNASNPYTYLIGDDDWVIGEEDDYIIGVRSTNNLPSWPNSNGKWIVAQMESSDGGIYLVGANGSDPTFIYDGSGFYPQIDGGSNKLSFDAESAAFTIGATATGGTSGASAEILYVSSDGGSGYLILGAISGGPFQDNETLTDGDGGSATANGASSAIPATNLSFPSGSGLTTADLDYDWTFKHRLFFIQKNSMNSWYLPVGQIAGELTKFSLGGQFKLGGYLVMGATWSRDTGSGLNAMCAFFSSEGEVAIYQGDNPAEAETWSLVGVYRIGKPLGNRSVMAAGGDLVVATDIGLPPLSRALDTDFSILGTRSVSQSIINLWNEEVALRGGEWNVALWPRKQMVAVALPTTNDQPPKWIVIDAQTGKASTYSNWAANCLHVYQDKLYFGDDDGAVYLAETSGLDDGKPYSMTLLYSFNAMNAQGYKNVTQLRAVWRGPYPVVEQINNRSDYDETIPAAPPASAVAGGSIWSDPAAKWGDPDTRWSSPGRQKTEFKQWKVAVGGGEVHAPLIQLTSGSVAPIDAELIRVDTVFQSGEIVV